KAKATTAAITETDSGANAAPAMPKAGISTTHNDTFATSEMHEITKFSLIARTAHRRLVHVARMALNKKERERIRNGATASKYPPPHKPPPIQGAPIISTKETAAYAPSPAPS